MKSFVAASAIAALALAPVLAPSPARAQGNDVVGQVQRLLGGNNNGQEDQRNAYERGRADQQRQQDARRERMRSEPDRARRPEDSRDSRNYDNGRGSGAYYSDDNNHDGRR